MTPIFSTSKLNDLHETVLNPINYYYSYDDTYILDFRAK
jgi:hypothetical protein